MCRRDKLIGVVTNKKWDSMHTKAGRRNHQTMVPSRSWVHCDGEGGNKLDQGGRGAQTNDAEGLRLVFSVTSASAPDAERRLVYLWHEGLLVDGVGFLSRKTMGARRARWH